MKPITVKGDQITAVQALRMFEAGQYISCPVCEAILDPIPAGVEPGAGRISGLVCPADNRHYLVYGDDAETMKKAREVMRRIAAKTNSKKTFDS